MTEIAVSGLINLETTLRVEGFPIEYSPVRFPFFGVRSTVSGVGYNVAKALTRLGNRVRFLSIIGHDRVAGLVRAALAEDGIPGTHVLEQASETAQSAILYDDIGRRQINVDLKDIQDQVYPPESAEQALSGCSLAVLGNVNFSRPLLARARRLGIPIATDVHAISDLDDPYNRDFMAAADILFMSHERLPCPPEEWARQVIDRFGTSLVVIGLGDEGALLRVRREQQADPVPAVRTRPVVNTIGAGDALFSAFVHVYARSGDPHAALRRAVVYASYKIGEPGAADGLLDAGQLEALAGEVARGRQAPNP